MSGGITFASGDGRYSTIDHNRFFTDHLFAETPALTRDSVSGRKKTMWDDSDGQQNHWLDCFCANIAAGEIIGASLGFRPNIEKDTPGIVAVRKPAPKRTRGFQKVKR